MAQLTDTVKLGNKERFDKEQIGIKELFMDYSRVLNKCAANLIQILGFAQTLHNIFKGN